MPSPSNLAPLSILRPPYQRLLPLADSFSSPNAGDDGQRGTALVWALGSGDRRRCFQVARNRPGGMALLVILPPAASLSVDGLLRATECCRPHSILPHHPQAEPGDLAAVLSRTPGDLPLEFTDYLAWRGIEVDLDTRRLVRKTIQLSTELRTVSGLARSLYMSRRALGRRFRSRGLPVPSHILHFGRVLRGALMLQATDNTLSEVANALDYPDGFALSNQMNRLTGLRPSTVRRNLGWEWFMEAWLRTEKAEGRLDFPLHSSGFELGQSGPSMLPNARDESAPLWRRRTKPPHAAEAGEGGQELRS